MADQRVEIIGRERLAATSLRMAAKLSDLSVVNGAIARYAAGRAAVYAPRLTGRLAYSIAGTGEPQELSFHTGVSYAAVQEFGSPGHNIRGSRYMARGAADAELVAVQAHEANLERLVNEIEGA